MFARTLTAALCAVLCITFCGWAVATAAVLSVKAQFPELPL